MSQEFSAIYEHGMLRPLTPLNLPESAEVRLTLCDRADSRQEDTPADPLLGLMANEPKLVDEIVAAAMTARELHPLRTQA